MKRKEVTESPMLDASGENAADITEGVALELSWPLLAWEAEWPTWGLDLEPASARVADEEGLARTRTWSRRAGRSWVRRTSRANAI